MKKFPLTKFSIVIFFLALTLSIIATVITFDHIASDMDEIGQYYMMRLDYDNKNIPVLGAYQPSGSYIGENNTSRIPGGFFILEYMTHFFIGGEDHRVARISYTIVMMISALVFLFWLYKKFGIITMAVVAALLLINGNFIYKNHSFYNPHTVLMLSFFFIPLLGEYIQREKSFIIPMLLFPILSLMWHAHFGLFISMIPTLIVYLIIRWGKTKHHLKAFGLGVFIAFLTYVPYLISEIQNGFFNTNLLLSRRDAIATKVTEIFQVPRIHTTLFYPTAELNLDYGKTQDYLNYWISNDSIALKIVFVFYVLSILFMLFTLFISFKHFFTKSIQAKNDKNKYMLKELLFFFLLYFVVTIVCYMIFRMEKGHGHYFYNAYTLSFIPIIYFIEYLKTKQSKLLKYVLIFILINTFALFSYIYVKTPIFYGNFYTRGESLKTILENSKGQTFYFDSNALIHETAKAYLGVENWKGDTNKNATLKLEYIFRNSYQNEDRFTNMNLIFSNDYHKIFRNDNINIKN